MNLHWVDGFCSMKINEVQVIVEIFVHVVNGLNLFSSQALVNTVEKMLLVELRSVHASYLLFHVFVLLGGTFSFHPGRLVLCPVVHLHLGKTIAVWRSLLIEKERLVESLQVWEH